MEKIHKLDDMSRVFLNNAIPDVITGRNIALLAFGQIALVVGLLRCYLLYARRCNRIGKLGLFLLLSGGILLAFGHVTFTPIVINDFLFILIVLGIFLMVIGLTLFGVVNLRVHALQYWQPLPLITGLLGIASFFLSNGDENPVVFLLLRTLFGMSLVSMGMIMWVDTRTLIGQDKSTVQYVG